MTIRTADLCDRFESELEVCEPIFTDFGGRRSFHGRISTVQCFEDNSRVREALASPGEGRVLVVDGGGSQRCSLLGDKLAALAVANGWAGVLVSGCVRDVTKLAKLELGVRALSAMPRRSEKRGEGHRDVTLRFAGVSFTPGHWLYADEDGIVVGSRSLD